MPPDTGMAFVLVSHMARGHESALPEILSRHTSMAMRIAADGAVVEPDHVYVCPPDHLLTIEGGKLYLAARDSDQLHKPIDVFLSALAEERGESAIGVVLSGGGSDGALGIKAIKERGGLTLAQGTDGSGPRQSSMPETAIATGFVDLTLPVDAMAGRLAEIARHQGVDAGSLADEERATEARQTIARILHDQVGHDFSGYK